MANDSTKIVVKGSQKGAYMDISGSTATQFPIIASTSIGAGTATESLTDEGMNEYLLNAASSGSWSGSFLERGKNALDLMRITLAGGFYHIVKEMSVGLVGGKNQYLVIAKGRPIESLTYDAPGSEIPFEFGMDNNSSAIGINLTSFNTAGDFAVTLTCTLFTIDANKRFGFYEQ